jgi:hypothetical protein
MLQKLISAALFAFLAIGLMQLINRSFSHVYTSVQTSVEKPYAHAQALYDQTSEPPKKLAQ